jgi:WD40 repeat protein
MKNMKITVYFVCLLVGLLVRGYAQSQIPKLTMQGHSNDVMAIAFSSDGKTLASSSIDKTVILWDTQTGQIKQRFTKHTRWVWSLALSSDDTTVASAGYDSEVWVWDAQTGQPRQQLKPHLSSLAFIEKGKVLLGAKGTSLYTWNTQNWKRDRKPSAHTEPIYVITLSGDGNLIASGDMGGTIIIWDIKSWQPVQKIKLQNWIKSLAFTPDNKRLAIGSAIMSREGEQIGGEINIRNLSNQSSVTLIKSAGVIWSVSVSPNGKLIAGAGRDGKIRIWDSETEKLKATFDGSDKLVSGVMFSPDGTLLASCGAGGIKLWEMNGLY